MLLGLNFQASVLVAIDAHYLSPLSRVDAQANRRALATDEWLRVEGTDSVYALGDCATINQRKVMVLFDF